MDNKLVKEEMERRLTNLRVAGTTQAQLNFIEYLFNKALKEVDKAPIETKKDAADFVAGILAGSVSVMTKTTRKK